MRSAVPLGVLALVAALSGSSMPSAPVIRAQEPVADGTAAESTDARRSAEVRPGRPRFACPAAPELAEAVTVVVEVTVSAAGRLMHFDLESPAPEPVLETVRQCLRRHWAQWEPAQLGETPVTHTWKAPFPFRVADRAAVAAALRRAHSCVQQCDEPPRAYVLHLELHIGSEGRLTRGRAEGGPPSVNACALRCYRGLDYPVRDTNLEVPVTVDARQPSTPVAALPPVPPPPPAGFIRGRARFACPFTRQTDFTRLRGEARIRVTVSAEGRLVAYRVTRGTSPLRAFVRRCMEANRDRWEPARDAASGAPVQATWDTRYRIEGEVWD